MALIQIQLRHDVATNWTSINPVMLSGEVGIETDTNKFKFGNGVDTWTALPYAAGEGGGTSLDVRHDGVIVVTSSNLDFRHGLDVVESVTGRAAIDVDETELSFVAAPIAVGRSFSLSGVLSPAQITADQNNYAPTGIADANFLRVSSDAARTITGISATATTGRVLLVVNTGNFAITLAHNSSSSLDANKMFFADNVDFILAPNSYAILVYDQSSLKWRGIGHRSALFALEPAITPDSTSAAGTAGTYARSGHTHGMTMSTATPQALGIGDPGTVGTAPSRGNHTHPTTGVALSSHTHPLSTSNPAPLGTAAPGSGTLASKDDHVHPTTGLALSGHTHSGGASAPTGAVVMYAGASAPSDWLLCDGSFVSKTTYAALWSLIGQQFNNGVDPGDGTFRLPDFRGRVPFGVDTVSPGNTLGAKFGQKGHTHIQPSHGHSLNGIASNSGFHNHSVSSGTGTPSNTVTVSTGSGANPGNATHFHSFSTTSASSGDHAHGLSGSALSASSGTSSTNDPPSLALNFIIKT